MRRFVIRTIKNGQVKIFGKIFEPDNKFMEYDGRLDGLRYAFGLYYTPILLDEQTVGYDIFSVNLWGPEENYKNPVTQTWAIDPQIVEGHYPWLIWWRV